MDLGLKGKVALVTGAASPIGFGRAIAVTLAQEGCDVIVTDINLEGAQKIAAEVKSLGRQTLAIKTDITKSSEVNNMVKEALKKFGKIDILINNAGIVTSFKPFLEQDEADWDKILNVNLKGSMICARAVLPHMIGRKSGKIVNISSSGAKKCEPAGEAYCASKAGVIAFTKSLALEAIGSGINVNCIAPGAANTNLGVEFTTPELLESIRQHIAAETPAKRATTPQDIASMVAYLVSDVASDIVGQTFSVDGGITMTA